MKSQDANTVQVAREVQKKVDEFVRNESGMKSIKTMDTAKPIEDSLYTMVEKAALGTIVTIIVIPFLKYKNYSYFNCIYTNVNINCAHSIKIKQRIIKYSYFRCINGCNRASYR